MPLSDEKFIRQMQSLAENLQAQIEADCSGFSSRPSDRQIRINRSAMYFAEFVAYYFPHYTGKKAFPEPKKKTPESPEPSVLHVWLFEHLPALVKDKKGRKLAIAAPRGEAKSTVISLFFVLWCLAFKKKHYICLIADAIGQAATLLECIKAELIANPRLAMDYPELCGEGPLWQIGTIVTKQNQKLEAFGSGKRIRGLRHGSRRPDLVLIDDVENDENVLSLDQRDKTESWILKALVYLGPPDGSMDMIMIGTLLHYDSVLARMMKNSLWESQRFQAILQWPHRMDLWETFETILKSSGEAAALAYYHNDQREMDKGAVVSWPQVRPLVNLMLLRAQDHSAFACEIQNDPVASDLAPFHGCITFWVNRLREWLFFGACDPSLGKSKKGDPSALLVGGYNRTTGILDVVEANIVQRVPDVIISDLIALQREYNCLAWLVENVAFQDFFKEVLVAESARLGCPIPAYGDSSRVAKEVRILSLQPHVKNGLIRLHASQTTLFEQLSHYPKAGHDDGPDALEMLWRTALRWSGGLPTVTVPQKTGLLSDDPLRGFDDNPQYY